MADPLGGVTVIAVIEAVLLCRRRRVGFRGPLREASPATSHRRDQDRPTG